jgi:protein involved in polysaccharide export with SLBB domain
MNQDRTLIIAFGIFAFALLFGGFAILTNRPAPVEIVLIPPIPTSTPAPPAPITVYITGAVHTPQTMIELPAGSRIQDAIDSVGGLCRP